MNREKKFTPGPWSVLSSGNEDLFIEKHKILTVTSVKTSDVNFQIDVMDASDNAQKADANANLISAAPELLEACERFTAGVDAHADEELKSRLNYHLSRMETAIKKAYGETE